MQQVKSEALNEEKGGGGGGGRYLLRVRPNLTGYSIWVNPPPSLHPRIGKQNSKIVALQPRVV